MQDNSARLIDISQLSKTFSPKLLRALPGFHAFTGCTYEPSLFQKGKKKTFKLLEKSEEFQEAFAEFGLQENLNENDVQTIEKYTSKLYGSNENSVDDARADIFFQIYKTKSTTRLDAKGLDTALLPPCKMVLVNKIKRVNYIAKIFKKSACKKILLADPIKCGWMRDQSNCAQIKYYDGDQYPNSIEQLLAGMDETVTDDELILSDDDEA